jgi:two-component system, OmpR family, sensor kinase
MLDSIRVRLALGHTAALAVVLLAFTGATAVFLAQLTRERERQDLVETVSVFHHAVQAELYDSRTAAEAARHAAREFRFSSRCVLVYDASSRLVAVSDSAGWRERDDHEAEALPDPARVRAFATSVRPGEPIFATLSAGEHERVPAYAAPVTVGGERFTIVALQIEDTGGEVLGDFLEAAAIAIPLALLLAGLGGSLLARRSLAPVMTMSEQAARIGARSLDERLPVQNPRDELGRLATVFNELLARLERAFTQQRQFMADASHELRTPVAILRAEADVALSRERSPEQYRESLEVMRTGAGRLAGIVENLFALARADAGHYRLRRSPLFLEELVADTVRSLRSVARARGVALEFAPEAEAPFAGDEALLRHLLLNLLDNALKYTPAGGRVDVMLKVGTGAYQIQVRDTGRGIPPGARPHVFERFYRGEEARAREAGSVTTGAGLGLAIARWIAETHGGALELSETGPSGSTFTLRLPAPPAVPTPEPIRREQLEERGVGAQT